MLRVLVNGLGEGSMRGVLAALAVLASCVAATQAAAQGKPGYTCPAGFTIGAKTPAEAVQLPRTQDAINDGLVTAAEALAHYQALDKNESGYICVGLPHGYEPPHALAIATGAGTTSRNMAVSMNCRKRAILPSRTSQTCATARWSCLPVACPVPV